MVVPAETVLVEGVNMQSVNFFRNLAQQIFKKKFAKISMYMVLNSQPGKGCLKTTGGMVTNNPPWCFKG